jgi:hypothetical protein
MHPVNKWILITAACVPLVAQSLSGSYRLIAEARYSTPISTVSNREATDITFGSKSECIEVAKGMTQKVRRFSDDMTNTQFNVICYEDGETDEYGSVYSPGDRKTVVLQRRELQDSVGRVGETSNTDSEDNPN